MIARTYEKLLEALDGKGEARKVVSSDFKSKLLEMKKVGELDISTYSTMLKDAKLLDDEFQKSNIKVKEKWKGMLKTVQATTRLPILSKDGALSPFFSSDGTLADSPTTRTSARTKSQKINGAGAGAGEGPSTRAVSEPLSEAERAIGRIRDMVKRTREAKQPPRDPLNYDEGGGSSDKPGGSPIDESGGLDDGDSPRRPGVDDMVAMAESSRAQVEVRAGDAPGVKSGAVSGLKPGAVPDVTKALNAKDIKIDANLKGVSVAAAGAGILTAVLMAATDDDEEGSQLAAGTDGKTKNQQVLEVYYAALSYFESLIDSYHLEKLQSQTLKLQATLPE